MLSQSSSTGYDNFPVAPREEPRAQLRVLRLSRQHTRKPLSVPIYIDAPAIPVEARRVDALLEDCSAALKDERCVESRADAGRRAIVELRGPAAENVRIWVYHDDGSRSFRELRFTQADPSEERWRAAGLVVAALLLVPQRTSPESVVDARATAARRSRAVPPPAGRVRPRQLASVWLAATAQPLVSNGPLQMGALLGVDAFPFRAPIGACLEAGISRSVPGGDGLSVSQSELAIGMTLHFPERAWLYFGFRALVLRERLQASAPDPTGSAASGDTFRSGVALALSPTLPLGSTVALFAGARAALYFQQPRIWGGETELGQARRVTPSGFLGVQARF